MLEFLSDCGLEVILIDNNSTHSKCVEWLDKCVYKVHRRKDNHIAWAFFQTELYELYDDRYFFISDSDYSYENVPEDFISVLLGGLVTSEHDEWKCGMSCEINDLPKNEYTDWIIQHEQQFWNPALKNKHGFYRAALDTGPAVYDREKRTTQDNWFKATRADRPYVVKHLDWYLTKENVREEDLYYIEHGEYFGYAAKWKQMIYDK